MSLKLEIVGPRAAELGAQASKTFSGVGGTIGRSPENDWVIADPYISSRHARIHFRAPDQYLLEDTSSNGVFVNSPDRRLQRGELYVLQNGDRLFLDTYEIRVTLESAASTRSSAMPFADPLAASPRVAPTPLIPEDPFGADDPFAPASSGSKPAVTPRIPDDFSLDIPASPAGLAPADSADPLELLRADSKRPQTPPPPRAQDLAAHSVINDHYQPPQVHTTPLREPSPAIVDAMIPEDYNPLLDDDDEIGTQTIAKSPNPPAAPFAPPTPPPRPVPGQRSAAPQSPIQSPQTRVPPPTQAPVRSRPATPPPVERPVPPPPPQTPPASPPPAAAMQPRADTANIDFGALLEGAGLSSAQISPELMQNFGQILRVVVSGLMEVLRARERIKDEFRMRMTTFKTADNNPLKFSANVEDALHNLLVKRNSAYLGPVEAFEDAFLDVRNHQMAMLAGVRAAFDAMLSEFDPQQLQERFDRQLKKGGLLAVPARMKYWELYRDAFQEMTKDPESTFRELFGEEFARAYEQQLERLKAAARAQRK
mgnify:CR=1 FL=1|jgi:type VI secretion system FHA domain protein